MDEQQIVRLMTRYAEAAGKHQHKKANAILVDLERARRRQLKREIKLDRRAIRSA